MKKVFWGYLPSRPISAGSVETAVIRRGEDWKRTACVRAEHQVQSSSIAPWERPEFASVQSKVPFAWHFLDNRSLINHWPWIRIFKGTTGAKRKGGACVRAWTVCVLVTQGACVSAGRTLSKLINTRLYGCAGCLHTYTYTTWARPTGGSSSLGTKISRSRLWLEKI